MYLIFVPDFYFQHGAVLVLILYFLQPLSYQTIRVLQLRNQLLLNLLSSNFYL